MNSQIPDFTGKHVMFCLHEPSPQPHLLQDITFETRDGKLWALGGYSDALPHGTWLRGLAAGLAWESVKNYTVFRSAEEYPSRIDVWINRPHRQIA